MQTSSSEKRWNIYQIVRAGMVALENLKLEGYKFKKTRGDQRIPWKEIEKFVNTHRNDIQPLYVGGISKKREDLISQDNLKKTLENWKSNSPKYFLNGVAAVVIDDIDIVVNEISKSLTDGKIKPNEFHTLCMIAAAAKLVHKLKTKHGISKQIPWDLVLKYILQKDGEIVRSVYDIVKTKKNKDYRDYKRSITFEFKNNNGKKQVEDILKQDSAKLTDTVTDMKEVLQIGNNNNDNNDNRKLPAKAVVEVDEDALSISTLARNDTSEEDSYDSGSSIDVGDFMDNDGGEDNNKKPSATVNVGEQLYREHDVRKNRNNNNNNNNNNNDNNSKKRSTEVKNVPNSKKKRPNSEIENPIATGTEFDNDEDIDLGDLYDSDGNPIVYDNNAFKYVSDTGMVSSGDDYMDEDENEQGEEGDEEYREEEGSIDDSDFDPDDDDNEDLDRFLNINNKLENLKF